MVNSIQLEGLTYVRSIPATTSNQVDGNDFESAFKKELNTANDVKESETKNTSEINSVKYTNPKDLVCVDSPDYLESYFQEAADTYGVPIALIKAVAKAESDFNPKTVSSAGAQGIMQLMPETAKGLGVNDSFDARENIMGGTKYLAKMLSKYNGSVKLSLAAYNAGAGNVKKYNGVPPFTETQNYIKKIFGYLGMDANKTNNSKETVKAEDKKTNSTQSTELSDKDIKDLADAIISGISNKNSSKSASELYSQLYRSASGNSALGKYSNIVNNLFQS